MPTFQGDEALAPAERAAWRGGLAAGRRPRRSGGIFAAVDRVAPAFLERRDGWSSAGARLKLSPILLCSAEKTSAWLVPSSSASRLGAGVALLPAARFGASPLRTMQTEPGPRSCWLKPRLGAPFSKPILRPCDPCVFMTNTDHYDGRACKRHPRGSFPSNLILAPARPAAGVLHVMRRRWAEQPRTLYRSCGGHAARPQATRTARARSD
jgi:hypothetical protein